jgi:hypothetical protein
MLLQDENNNDVNIEPPAITNILPVAGFFTGAAICIFGKKEERIEKILAYAFAGAFIGALPRLGYLVSGLMAANKDAAGSMEMQQTIDVEHEELPVEQEGEFVDDGANSAGGDENEIVVNVSGGGDASTEQILEIFDSLSEANQTEASWLPRRMHFENEIETFSQVEKNALFDLVSIAMDVPDEDNTKEIEKFMLELNAIEMDYGKEVYALVNEKMDQINSVLNREFTEQARVLAA